MNLVQSTRLGRVSLAVVLCGLPASVAASPEPQAGPAAPASAAIGPPSPASTADLDKLRDELKAATDRLQRQDDDLKALRARVEEAGARADAAAQQAAAVPATVEERMARFLDQNHTVAAIRKGLSLSGFLQFDYQNRESSDDQLNPTSAAPLNQNLFFLRRARLRLTADYGVVGGLVEFDGNTVNGAAARILAIEASLRWPAPTPGALPYIGLTAGVFKIPFGFEVGQRDVDRLFMERSNGQRAIFPGEYDLGVRLAGGWRFLRYAIAAMNGDPLGERLYPGRDPNSAKDFVGRVGVDLDLGAPVHLSGGFSGLVGTGFSRGKGVTKDAVVWRDRNDNGVVDSGELDVIVGTAATESRSFGRFALGGDLQLSVKIPVLGALTLYGEVLVGANMDRALVVAEPTSASTPDRREVAWYLAATLELTRWAQVGVRYDTYQPDQDGTQRQQGSIALLDRSVSTLAIAGALRYRDLARLSVEYEINRNHNGRDATGLPINLADNALLVRAQLVF